MGRVFAGLHIGRVLLEDIESTNAAFRSATLELDVGTGRAVSFLFEDEMIRDEFVLCVLLLTDVARGRSLRLSTTTREEEEEKEEQDDDEEDEDEDKNASKSSTAE